MAHLIDKSALVAEIKRRKKEWSYGSSTEAKYKAEAYKELIEWLDTFELKEVDLTNSFIEKAVEWFRRIDYDDSMPPFETTEEFIEGFIKAMEQ